MNPNFTLKSVLDFKFWIRSGVSIGFHVYLGLSGKTVEVIKAPTFDYHTSIQLQNIPNIMLNIGNKYILCGEE